MRTDELKSAKPFIKWAGGKRQLIPTLLKHVPSEIETYYEPFLGGGALFWEIGLRARRVILSDLNKNLIITYEVVRDNVEALIGVLTDMQKAHSECYYYSIRAASFAKKLDKAAAFIYLNKTCFNGLYRVNKKGKFNVPYGKYKNPMICDEDNLRLCSARLNQPGVEIHNSDFYPLRDRVTAGDFVYKELKERRAKVVMSNSSAPEIIKLCEENGLSVHLVQARRSISSIGDTRDGVSEIIVE